MNTFTTIESIVDDLLAHLSSDDADFLFGPEETLEQIWGRSAFGRWIRNHYGLWHDHPLTERWRREGPNDLREGVDYSEDHPDNLSGVIMESFRKRLPEDRWNRARVVE